jgi:hypothetical protein
MSSNRSYTEQEDPTAYLRSATFTRSEPSTASLDNAVTASDLLMGAYDPAKLHPMADLGEKLDYLLLEDDKTTDLPGAGTAIPSRGWSDDLCYGTGTMYLSGEWRLFLFTRFCSIPSPFGSSSLEKALSRLISTFQSATLGFLIVLSHHMLTVFY